MGGHNLLEFNQIVIGGNLKIINNTPHPTVEGLRHIEYQIPSFDRAGNINGYKNKIFSKTVYDPKRISDEQIIALGQQAAARGYPSAIEEGVSQFTSNAEELSFRVYIRNDVVDNFHPEF